MVFKRINRGRINNLIMQFNHIKAIKLNQNNYEIFKNFAFSLSQINQLDEAIYNYHKAISLKEDFDST